MAIEVVNQTTNSASSTASRVVHTHEMVHEDPSKQAVSSSQFLSKFQGSDRKTWVQLVTVLVQYCEGHRPVSSSTPLMFGAAPDAFRWVPEFIVRLAVEDTDDGVQNACVSSLRSLVELGW